MKSLGKKLQALAWGLIVRGFAADDHILDLSPIPYQGIENCAGDYSSHFRPRSHSTSFPRSQLSRSPFWLKLSIQPCRGQGILLFQSACCSKTPAVEQEHQTKAQTYQTAACPGRFCKGTAGFVADDSSFLAGALAVNEQLVNLGRVLQQQTSSGALDSSSPDVPDCLTPWEIFNSTAELSFWAEALQTVGFAGKFHHQL